MESRMAYEDLTDEVKIEQAIKFVALGQPLPDVLEVFLKEADLYDLIVNGVSYEEDEFR